MRGRCVGSVHDPYAPPDTRRGALIYIRCLMYNQDVHVSIISYFEEEI